MKLSKLTWLEYLDIRQTAVTTATVATLQKALPKCKINSNATK